MSVSRLMLDLGNIPARASKTHELATWLLALAQSLEAESRRAADFAVHLGAIIAECELILATAKRAARALPRHN